MTLIGIQFESKVACGAASHLRLKFPRNQRATWWARRRMWSGFSSEIEIIGLLLVSISDERSHVERLLI